VGGEWSGGCLSRARLFLYHARAPNMQRAEAPFHERWGKNSCATRLLECLFSRRRAKLAVFTARTRFSASVGDALRYVPLHLKFMFGQAIHPFHIIPHISLISKLKFEKFIYTKNYITVLNSSRRNYNS
jgi:hypothetical protein